MRDKTYRWTLRVVLRLYISFKNDLAQAELFDNIFSVGVFRISDISGHEEYGTPTEHSVPAAVSAYKQKPLAVDIT